MPAVETFLFDDENEEKIGIHGLSIRQVSQVLDNSFVITRNRKRRRGVYLIIGTDNGGNCIAIPIEATHRPGEWRPITAWPCKDAERALLNRLREDRR